MEELQAIEEESVNDEHDSKATQESDLEQMDSDNYLTDDEHLTIQDSRFTFSD